MLCQRVYKDMQKLSSVFKGYIIVKEICGSRTCEVAGRHGLAALRGTHTLSLLSGWSSISGLRYSRRQW